MHYWETVEYRAKYNAGALHALAAKGQALKNSDGSISYPVADAEDLGKAIMAVGRGNADHDSIRLHIIQQAAKLGLSKEIPDNWNADGSLKQSNSAKKPHHRSLPLTPEHRSFALDTIEVRTASADGSGDKVDIIGSPIVYNRAYDVQDMLGKFSERMSPGVASSAIHNGDDVRFLFDHQGLPLARTAAGTMQLLDTADKLQFRATLDLRQQLANDLVIAIERGDVSQMSCGFSVADDDWNSDYTERTIHRFQKMYDVSAVTYPASPTTGIEIAQRMLMEQPLETRARVRKLWAISNELRAGKVLSQDNADALTNALGALSSADGALTNLAAAHQEMTQHLGGMASRAGFEGYDPVNSDDQGSGDVNFNADGSLSGPDTSSAPMDGSGSRSGRSTASLRMELDLIRSGVKLEKRAAAKPLPDGGATGGSGKPFEPGPYHVDPDELVECPQCQKMNDFDARFCDQCGEKLLGNSAVKIDHPPFALPGKAVPAGK